MERKDLGWFDSLTVCELKAWLVGSPELIELINSCTATSNEWLMLSERSKPGEGITRAPEKTWQRRLPAPALFVRNRRRFIRQAVNKRLSPSILNSEGGSIMLDSDDITSPKVRNVPSTKPNWLTISAGQLEIKYMPQFS